MKNFLFTASALVLVQLTRAQVNLGTAASFGVLGGSTVTNTGLTVVSGNLGVSPGSAVTGFPPGLVHNGAMHKNDAVAIQAQSDVTVAYNAAGSRAADDDLTGQDLAGKTLVAGTYSFSSSAGLTGSLTLDGKGSSGGFWIFQIGSTLTTSSSASVRLIGGAQSCNIFWRVGSSATLGTTTSFAGNILALTSITVNGGVTVNGGLYARNGAVSLDSDSVNGPALCGGGSADRSASPDTSSASTSPTASNGATSPGPVSASSAPPSGTSIEAAADASPTSDSTGSPLVVGDSAPAAGGSAPPPSDLTGSTPENGAGAVPDQGAGAPAANGAGTPPGNNAGTPPGNGAAAPAGAAPAANGAPNAVGAQSVNSNTKSQALSTASGANGAAITASGRPTNTAFPFSLPSAYRTINTGMVTNSFTAICTDVPTTLVSYEQTFTITTPCTTVLTCTPTPTVAEYVVFHTNCPTVPTAISTGGEVFTVTEAGVQTLSCQACASTTTSVPSTCACNTPATVYVTLIGASAGGPFLTLTSSPTPKPTPKATTTTQPGSSAVFTRNCPTVPTTFTTGYETFTVTTKGICTLTCQACAYAATHVAVPTIPGIAKINVVNNATTSYTKASYTRIKRHYALP